MSKIINKINATVSGLPGGELHVCSFELVAAVNSIPYICLDVLPISSGTSKGHVSASASDFSALTELYNTLYPKAEERFNSPTAGTKGTVKIEVNRYDSSGNGTNKQNMTLSNWILTDVSLSNVTTISAPTLTIVLKHPAEVLDRVGEIYETPRTFNRIEILSKAVEGKDSMIGILDSLYTTFASGKPIQYYPPADVGGGPAADSASIQKFRSNILSCLPSTHLKDNCNGIFLGSAVQDAPKLLKLGIALSVTRFDRSIWLTVVNTVCPLCLAQVIPTYKDETFLGLEPYNPWNTVEYQLSGNMIESLNIASQDPDPVIGIATLGTSYDYTPDTDKGAMQTVATGKKEPQNFQNMFYIASGAGAGRIEQIGENRIIGNMRDFNAATVDKEIQGAQDTLTYKDYIRASSTYAKGMFQAIYKKNCRASVTTVLTFEDASNNVIYPGRVLSVLLGAGGSATTEVLHGYVTRAIIRGSTEGDCTSTFEMSTARPGIGSNLVEENGSTPWYG